MGVSLTIPSFVVAADLETIQKRGQLIVAVKDNSPPLGFRSTDGQLQGLEIEIAERLAQELLGPSATVKLKPVLNQARLSVVLNGDVDIAIARMTLTDSRSRVASFSIPYYLDGTALITNDATVQLLTDLTRQKVGVLNNSSTVDIVRQRFPQAKLVAVDSYTRAQQLLEQDEIAAFAADASVLSGWVKEMPHYRLLTPTLSVEPLCIVLPRGLQYEELRRRINEILTRWQAEGWLKQRAAYWNLP